jgi:cell division control protein 6
MRPLSDLLVDSKIFANREILSPHFTPKKLLYREKEIGQIQLALVPSLKGSRGRNLFVYGPTGTGKTSCVKYVVDEIRNIPNTKARISFINCRIYNSRYRALNKIISDHLPTYAKRGYGAVDLYEKLTSWIEEDSKILVAILDEIDQVKDLDDLIYTLTRINSDIRAGGVTLIGISNKVSFKEELDPRSLSTLHETELSFGRYYATELYAIMKDRSEEGFKKNTIDDETLHLIAASATKEGGDARFCLKILTKAGELADERGEDRISIKDAHDAVKMAENEIVYDVVGALPEHQKLVLYSVVMLTNSGGMQKRIVDGPDIYLFSGQVYDRYKSLAEGMHKEPKSERWYRKYLSELQMQGLIESYESGKGIRGHTKLVKLHSDPKKMGEVLEKDIFGAGKEEIAAQGSA